VDYGYGHASQVRLAGCRRRRGAFHQHHRDARAGRRYNAVGVGYFACSRSAVGLDPAFNYGGLHGTRSDGKAIESTATDQFAVEMDDFARCILEKTPTRVPGEEGLRDVKLMMAIYESARTGRPVELHSA